MENLDRYVSWKLDIQKKKEKKEKNCVRKLHENLKISRSVKFEYAKKKLHWKVLLARNWKYMLRFVQTFFQIIN